MFMNLVMSMSMNMNMYYEHVYETMSSLSLASTQLAKWGTQEDEELIAVWSFPALHQVAIP